MKRPFLCRECGAPGEFEPIPGFERQNERPKLCTPCDEKQIVELERKRLQERKLKLEADWLKLCPPSYRLTNPKHPDINQAVLSYLLKWRHTGSGTGIALIGNTGLCKTRMMFLLIRKLHFAGVRVAAINTVDLSRCWSRSFGDDMEADRARETVRRCRNAEVLFLDDVGKGKFTERTEAEFYSLIEYRTSHLKPIHWTANADGKQLETMISADRGSPIVRRLRESSEIPVL